MTPELTLLLACSRALPGSENEAAIRQMLGDGIDWTLFARKAVEHGLAGLAGHGLAHVAPEMVPEDILNALRVVIDETRSKNQALFSELAGVVDALSNDGIEAIPFKGPVLGIRAYGDLGLRVGELHLLVRDADMPSTMTTLFGLGYQRRERSTEAQFEVTARARGEDILSRPVSGTVLGLRTRLTPMKMAIDIDYAGLWRRAQPAAALDRTMMMLAPEDDLVVLAVLGCNEMWWRINRVCDIAAFIVAHRNLDWSGTIERAREQGCLRMLLLATSLSRRHFNAATPEAITQAERADPVIERLVQRVTRRWLRDEAAGPPSDHSLSKDRFWLHDGVVRRMRYVARTWGHADFLRSLGESYCQALKKRGRSGDKPAGTDDLAALARPTEAVSPELEPYEAARADAVRVLSIDFGNIEARYDLAASLLNLRRHNDAINAFRAVLAIAPDHVRAQHGLATALLRKADHDGASASEALNLFRLILVTSPDDAKAHFGAGRALQRLEREGEAATAFRRSIALSPDSAAPLNALGRLHRATGDLDAAQTVFAAAMALEPENVSVLYNVTMAGKVRGADPVLANLQAVLEREQLLPFDLRVMLHFALGKAYEDVGEPDRGFTHLLEGNAIRRQRVRYDEVKVLAYLEQIRHVFSADLFATARAGGNSSEVPIFIVGMPRSGSSLIEQILASHPSVFGAGERDEFGIAMDRQLQRLGASLTRGNFAAIASPTSLSELGTRYVESIRPLAPNAPRIVDKQLFNFCRVGLMHLALPNARIIHSLRDPIDTCLSCFSHTFSGDGSFECTYDLGELGRFYRGYTALMAHWRTVLPPGAMLEVEYESVVRNFEPMARRILAHCGLEWNDACLTFHQTKRPVWTTSALQVRQPLYQTSIGRWRPSQELLRPLLEGLASN